MEKPWYKVWPQSIPKTIKIPELTLNNVLEKTAKKYPNKAFMAYRDKDFTFKWLAESSKRLRDALVNLGLKKTDKVVLLMFNTPEWTVSFFGSLGVGAGVATIDPTSLGDDLLFQIEDCKPKIIITNREVYDRERKVMEKIDAVKVVSELVENPLPNTCWFNDLLKPCHPTRKVTVNPKKDVAAILYYAGIVGKTEQVFHTHQSLLAAAVQTAAFLDIGVDEGTIQVAPFGRIFGLCMLLLSVYTGCQLVVLEKFDPEETLKAIEKYKLTFLVGVPTFFIRVANHPTFLKERVKTIKWCGCGGAPVPIEIHEKFEEIGIPMLQIYGMTESPWVTNTPITHRVYGSIGIPMPNVDVRIMDPETGTKQMGIGEVGELVIKSPATMKGYASREDTKIATRKGWLYSGDLVKTDENGMLYYVDIKKRMLKYKGYPVFPSELEQVLMTHDAVKECKVVGKPAPEVGEIPKAYVVLKDEYIGKIDENELMNFVNSKLSPIKAVRELEFTKETPK